MKTGLILYLAIFLLAFNSCKKQDFSGIRPDKRLIELKNEYTKILTEAKNGWIGYLYPRGGNGYTFKFKFDVNNRVKTLATVDREYGEKEFDSSFRIEMDQLPTLMFDTYSSLHIIADPDGNASASDFEFSILKIQNDTIRLRGNHNESELLLVKAGDNQGDDFIQKAFAVEDQIISLNQFSNYYKKITINNEVFSFNLNPIINVVSFSNMVDGKFKFYHSSYVLTDNGIRLQNPIELNGLAIREMNNLNFQKPQGIGNLLINKEMNIKVESIDKPLYLDKEAPRRMHMDRKSYFSHTGLTINGVFDALELKKMPSFVGVLFVPRVTLTNLDGSYIIYYAGERYVGPQFNSFYKGDGKINFVPYELMTGYNPGPNHLARVQEFIRLWFIDGGYYVVQTAARSYDLVSVANPKLWIRFN
ncbi:DUF4302 domain-containing protein [Sphingobacterium kyonggiense]